MRNPLPIRVQLGAFELDLKAGELRKAGRKVRLQEQPFQILRMLVERSGELVTTEEIQRKLWPNDTVVEFDHSIHTAMKKLRQALGDSAGNPRYIETVARRGYRLMVPVERLDSSSGDAQAVAAVSSGQDETTARIEIESAALTGKTISHYRVLHVIGGGGMGVVYKAEDLKLGRAVAVKFLPEEVGSDPRALERFEREARTASSLNHPNICTIYEIEEHERQPFIVMELLEGRTLRDRLAAATSGGEPLSIDQVLNIALQISEGVEAAHEKGIIHRDIKPANIFITIKGVIKILDFGLAKLVLRPSAVQAIPAELGGKESLNLSRAGVAIGTAAYMSPEQVRGEKLDARTDLFSFGLVLYEIATGRRAFTGDSATAVQDAILNRAPTPPAEVNPELPAKLQDVIQKCLEKDRNLRFQSAAEVRTGLEKVQRRRGHPVLSRWKLLATAAVVVIALLAGGLYWRSRRTPKLTEKDTIVLADFVNSTGETVFDDTLKQGLAVDLEQSAFLNILSDEKVAEQLRYMGLSPQERLSRSVAQEVCQRSGSKAVLLGSVSRLGDHYAIGLKAVNCQTGDTLGEEQVEADRREDILKQLHEASNKMRQILGESLTSIKALDFPVDATTPSLEALKAFSMAVNASAKSDTEAIPYYKRAIELDPNFPYAHLYLGLLYSNRGEADLAADSVRKAYAGREKVSEKERLLISSTYYSLVTGELEKEAQTYQLWIQSYPRDPSPYVNLVSDYMTLGRYEKALAVTEQALRLEPEAAISYFILASEYLALNRLEDAKHVFEQATAKKLDGGYLHLGLYRLAFLRGDASQMEQQLAWGQDKPGDEDMLLSAQADTEAYHGRLQRARDFTRQAVDAAIHADSKETAALWEVNGALQEAELGNPATAKRGANAALLLAPGRDVKMYAALALARAGDESQADKISKALENRNPINTVLNFYWLPTIKAASELAHGESAKALASLEATRPYELGATFLSYGNLYPAYLRGEAYLLVRNGPAAATEFQKFLDHSGIVVNSPLAALAYVQLARAQVLSGDSTAATKNYEKFFSLWADADLGIPVLQQAKSDYQKLTQAKSKLCLLLIANASREGCNSTRGRQQLQVHDGVSKLAFRNK